MPRAREAFSAVLSNYPKGKKAPDAMLKLAYTVMAMGDRAEARSMLDKLLKQHPDSPAAAKAREKLGAAAP